MATASSFEAHTETEGYQAYPTTDAMPQMPLPAALKLVPGVGSGYRELAQSRSGQSHPLAALLLAMVGIGLGVLAGTWLATGNLHFAALLGLQAKPVVTQSAHPTQSAAPAPKKLPSLAGEQAAAAAFASAQAAAPKPAASLLGTEPVPAQEKPAPEAVPSNPQGTPLTQKALSAPTVSVIRHAPKRTMILKRMPQRTRLVLPASKPRLALPEVSNAGLATPMPALPEAPTPALTLIEGDVTVADFDEDSGRIETREGKSFQLGSSYDAPHSVPWPDFRANLHYRCDQSGNCSLARPGAVSPHAKLVL